MSDKAGVKYWDGLWSAGTTPKAVDPSQPGLRNLFNRRMVMMFQQVLSKPSEEAQMLLEVGCARSTWLPYFAQRFGFAVTGLDYSEIGCVQEKEILLQSGVEGKVVCADLFAPPPALIEAFDAVVSFGVIEHFSDPSECIAAMRSFLKPKGRMVSIVPNLAGAIGLLMQRLNRPIYDIHIPMTREQVAAVHRRAGMDVVSSEYVLSVGFGMANVNGLDPRAASTQAKRALFRTLERLSVLVWALEDRSMRLPNTRWFSPYICCVAQEPCTEETS